MPATTRRRSPKAADARAQAVRDAVTWEVQRFNSAVRDRAWDQMPVTHTAFGWYRVMAVSDDWWYTTGRAELATMPDASSLDRRSFAGCNDARWADLLRQVGVARHATFKEYR